MPRPERAGRPPRAGAATLVGVGRGSGVVGLVLSRRAPVLGHEPFFGELTAGIEEVLAARGLSLLVHVVPDRAAEVAAHRRWAAGSMVEAVVVVDTVEHDPRVPELLALGVPAVVVGGPRTGSALTSVWIDDARAVREAVTHLVDLGHTRLARVSGPGELAHTRARTEAFVEQCGRSGVEAVIVEGDYTADAGARAAASLLARDEPPSAVVFDNDVMALAALAVAGEAGVDVPGRLSLLAWDDSALCRLADPPLSAMTLDVHGMGRQVGQCVLDVLAGAPARTRTAPVPRLTARGSTGPLAPLSAGRRRPAPTAR